VPNVIRVVIPLAAATVTGMSSQALRASRSFDNVVRAVERA
jgi:hypothetical protein